MKRVFFDESGNTGQNLIDEADPIFVLASCSFDTHEESNILSHFQQFKGRELKFSRLRKTATGRKAVFALLSSPEVTSKTIAAFMIHKPFMVVTKYCDLGVCAAEKFLARKREARIRKRNVVRSVR